MRVLLALLLVSLCAARVAKQEPDPWLEVDTVWSQLEARNIYRTPLQGWDQGRDGSSGSSGGSFGSSSNSFGSSSGSFGSSSDSSDSSGSSDSSSSSGSSGSGGGSSGSGSGSSGSGGGSSGSGGSSSGSGGGSGGSSGSGGGSFSSGGSSSGSGGGSGGSSGSGGGSGGGGSGDGRCGKSSSSTRIVGGERAEIEQYPWMAALIFSSSSQSWTCGGSLISKLWVLTAAHCTEGATRARVNLGSTLASSPLKTFTSRTLITHESYNAETLANDIALIRLPSAVTISDKIRPVCLPRQSVHGSATFDGVSGQVSGWGRYSDSSQSGSEFLRHVTVPIMSNDACTAWDPPATQLCVDTSGGKSACNGDSGGPLQVQQSDGTYLEVGVVSYGARAGCEKGVPAVFTRVTEYLSWISGKTGINLS